MALHPGEAGYDEQFENRAKRSRERANYNEKDWPGHAGFSSIQSPQPRHIYEIADDIAELEREAALSCRCDGGNNNCRACSAERRLKELKMNNGKRKTNRFSASAPNIANTPKSNIEWGAKLTHTPGIGQAVEWVSRDEAERKIAEAKGDGKPRLPVGVSVMVTDSSGRLLLGRRKNNSGAGLLSTPGGRLEENETIHQCAAREFFEECGIDDAGPRDFDIIGFKEHFRFGGHYIMFYVHIALPDGVNITNMEPDKCEGWNWVSFGDLRADETTEPTEILARLATKLAGW